MPLKSFLLWCHRVGTEEDGMGSTNNLRILVRASKLQAGEKTACGVLELSKCVCNLQGLRQLNYSLI